MSAFAIPAQAKVLWRGSFENGTRSEFSRYHAVESTPPRINVIQKPVADGLNVQGTKAARVEVRKGDNGRKLDPTTGKKIGDNVYNERAELAIPTRLFDHEYLREGDDVWMSWQAMFPSDKWWGRDPKGGGTIVYQIHHVRVSNDTYDGSPPLMLTADNERLHFIQCLAFKCPNTVTRYSAPIVFDHWYTFTLHAKHSANESKGLLEFWVDGERVVNTKAALLFGSDFGNYMLTGQYRRPNTERDSVFYIDNYVIGTTREDVMPPVTPPPPPPPPPEPPVVPEPTEPEPPVVPEPPVPEPNVPEPGPGDVDPVDPEGEEPDFGEPGDPDPEQPQTPTPDDSDPTDTTPRDDSGWAQGPGAGGDFNDLDVRFEKGGCAQAGGSMALLFGLLGLVIGRRRADAVKLCAHGGSVEKDNG